MARLYYFVTHTLATITLALLASAGLCAQPGYWDTHFGPAPVSNGEAVAVAVYGSDVIVGGSFGIIDDVRANHIAYWSESARKWTPLDSGTNGNVSSIVISGSKAYVAGSFTRAGSVPVKGIAEWDLLTRTWSALGDTSLFYTRYGNVTFNTLRIEGDNLYAGNTAWLRGADTTFGIARWHIPTRTWFPVGGGIDSNSTVNSLAISGEKLYVGGFIRSVGTARLAVENIAQFDLRTGTWSAMGTGIQGNVASLFPYGSLLYVGGNFDSTATRSRNIMRWNATTSAWEMLPSGLGGPYHSVSSMTADERWIYLTLANRYSNPLPRVYRLNPATGVTEPLPDGPSGQATAAGVSARRLYVVGTMSIAEVRGVLVTVYNIDSSRWHGLYTREYYTLNGHVRAIAADSAGGYVGGSFTQAGFNPVGRIAFWNGISWDSLAGGVDGAVRAIARHDRNVYVGGEFVRAGGSAAPYIARWSETTRSWSRLGAEAFDGPVNAIAIGQGGEVYVGGEFAHIGDAPLNGVAVWNGARWDSLGSGVTGTVTALASIGGILYVGGSFASAGGDESISQIAAWNPAARTWSSLQDGTDNPVTSLLAVGSSLYVGGPFTRAGDKAASGIARWNGTRWDTLGPGLSGDRTVFAMTMHSGVLVATGRRWVSDTTNIRFLAAFDGVRWNEIAGGLDSTGYAVASNGGDLLVGGDFRTAGGVSSRDFAIWHGSAAGIGREDFRTSDLRISVLPNPLAGSGTIIVKSDHPIAGDLRIVNTLGRVIRTIPVNVMDSGERRYAFDGDDIQAGAYRLVLSCGGRTESIPLIIR